MSLLERIWISLESFGVKGTVQSLHDLRSWLRRAPVLYIPPTLIYTGEQYIRSPTIRYSSFTLFMRGSYGSVYQALCEKESGVEVVFVKHSPTHETQLLLEGFLQHIAHTVLEAFGCPTAVPKVLDIVRHPTLGVSLVLQRVPGSQLFSDYLRDTIEWGVPSRSNDLRIFDVIGQVASYCAILEQQIGLNHRDLKGTNVLMVAPGRSNKSLDLKELSWTLHRRSEAILIDFGFACMGGEGGASVSAGELLSQGDFCPKEGRDLFVLIGSLWNVPSLRESLSETGQNCIKQFLRTEGSSVSWAEWIVEAAFENLNALYLLTSSSTFRSSSCSPLHVVRSIAEAYPECITIETKAE
jgi:serine/threonine protein kinase